MNWKEQFAQYLDGTKHRAVITGYPGILTDVQDFISTEIIEKLIEDIPDRITEYEEGIETVKLGHFIGLKSLKQQLRDRWL